MYIYPLENEKPFEFLEKIQRSSNFNVAAQYFEYSGIDPESDELPSEAANLLIMERNNQQFLIDTMMEGEEFSIGKIHRHNEWVFDCNEVLKVK